MFDLKEKTMSVLYDMTHPQAAADALKWTLDGWAVSPRERSEIRTLINLFEASDWDPVRFEEQLAEHAAGRFVLDERGLVTYELSEGSPAAALSGALRAYLQGTRLSRPISTVEAAAYLGLTVRTVKYHVYESGSLQGQKVGGILLFAQEELERFRAVKRPPGNPNWVKKDG